MAGSGMYTIKVNGILDDSKIRAQLAQIEAQMARGGIGAVTGTTKGGKKGATVFGAAGKDAKNATKQVNTFAGATKRASLNLLDVGKKVVAFGAVTSAIQMASAGVGSMVKNVVDLDASLREYKKVSDLTGKGLEDFTNKAYKVGQATAKTGVEMIDAAT